MPSLRAFACYIGILLMGAMPLTALASTVSQFVPNAELVGSGRLSFLFKDIYNISLYAPAGRWHSEKPFALEIEYLIKIPKEGIVSKTIDEMIHLGVSDTALLERWRKTLLTIIPDVKPGSVITGIQDAGSVTYFFSGEQKLGEIKNPQFGPNFFGIWLASGTSNPALRRDLLNQ